MSYNIAFTWGAAPSWVKDQTDRPRPCRSQAGWYVGADDPDTGEAIARWSEEYYPSKHQCNVAIMHDNWTRRMNP